MLAGIKDILIICRKDDIKRFEDLFGKGHKFGINISYEVQKYPGGIAEAFIIGKDFIGEDNVCLVLGDNIFYGNDLKNNLKRAVVNLNDSKATIFGHYVNDANRFGIVEFDGNGSVVSIEEKPSNPKSNYAVVGLYFYPNDVVDIVKKIKPSKRNELEITDINNEYLSMNRLNIITFGRGFTWLDTGTFEALSEASMFVKMVENHQGLKISCLEEIAYNNGWITKEELIIVGKTMANNQYGKHLLNVADGKVNY